MESVSFRRRALLRGRLRNPEPFRPPWALGEAEFAERCTRCDACIQRCPTRVIARGDGGFPEFRPGPGACTFCRECVAACETGALASDARSRPWTLLARTTPRCLAERGVYCASCRESCEAGALRLRPAVGGICRPAIDSGRCSGCGACVSACPVRAVELVRIETSWISRAS